MEANRQKGTLLVPSKMLIPDRKALENCSRIILRSFFPDPTCVQKPSENAPKVMAERCQSDAKMTPRWPQNDPQMTPKLSQDDPKMTPRWSQNDPKMSQKWSQDAPKWPQDDPKRIPWWLDPLRLKKIWNYPSATPIRVVFHTSQMCFFVFAGNDGKHEKRWKQIKEQWWTNMKNKQKHD